MVYLAVFGGQSFDFPQSVALDSAGRAVVVGSTSSSDFPLTEGMTLSKPTGQDWMVFVRKLTEDGSHPVYSTLLGGKGRSYGSAVASDKAGNVCVGGSTMAANFPVTSSAAQTKFGGAGGRRGSGDAFVAKFDPAGKLLYASYFGGASDEGATAVAINGAGECIIAGFTASKDLPVTRKAAYSKKPPNGVSGFLAQFSANGERIVYGTYLPHDVLTMTVDGDGFCYAAGTGWLTKIGLNGKRAVWSSSIGAKDGDYARALAIDADGHVRVVMEDKQGGKGSIVRVRKRDGSLAGAIAFGDREYTAIYGVAVDAGGRLWITGGSGQPEQAFVALLDSDGRELLRRGPGNAHELRARTIALDGAGNAIVAGQTAAKEETAEEVFVWKLRINTATGRTANQTQTGTLATILR